MLKDSVLRIHDLELNVRLGCEPAEREFPQPVLFQVEVRFPALPKACQSDALSDSICYAKVSDELSALVDSREFHLIESLAFDAYSVIREKYLRPEHKLQIKVHKLYPPIDHKLGGTSFELGDGF